MLDVNKYKFFETYSDLPATISQIKPIVCLSGDTIFGGGLLSQPSLVDIRVEVVITGESEQKVTDTYRSVIDLFINCVFEGS